MTPIDQLTTIKQTVADQLASGTPAEELRIAVLGRKGSLTAVLRTLSTLPIEERKEVGSYANQVKKELEELLDGHGAGTSTAAVSLVTTVPAFPSESGSIHPISQMIDELVCIFEGLSFEVVEGNELVTDMENFESLNFSKDHPARDSHDTFYTDPIIGAKKDMLLRTHTSSVQVIELKKRMKAGTLPARFIVPGKTYRRDSDATHSPMFHQLEGVVVDNQTTFADLRGVLDYVAKRLFGSMVETRFRTHYFPFTEPSAEMDIRWKDEKAGRSSRWIEWLGCGMIHPNVLEAAGINSRIYQGWAFGLGVERPIMTRNQVSDLRAFYENSIDFLDQFGEAV